MQVSALSNQYLVQQNSLASSTLKPSASQAVSSQSQDRVTLSPQAMREFEKLAAFAGPAGDYLPKVNVLNNSDSHKVGYAAWEMDFREKYKDELAEYSGKFHDYYQDAKAEHDIKNADDHYEKVLKAENFNPDFQQTFTDILKADPRMLELMDILGIKQPA